jgi:hypothetical protein
MTAKAPYERLAADRTDELRPLADYELDQVTGGSITRRIDSSSAIFFQNAVSGVPMKVVKL